MKTVLSRYAGATLEVAEFLAHLLPEELPLELWPSFCGCGDGLGDWLVPDKIYGVVISPACLNHDVEWATSKRTWLDFQSSNNRLRRNLHALTDAHIDSPVKRFLARRRGDLYWAVVSSPLGWSNFNPCGENPWSNPVVRNRLNRLARANYGLDRAN